MTTLIPCARVSTRDQNDHGTSLDSQVAACLAYIARLGAKATMPISEDVTGMARLEDRPKGRDILTILDAGAADATLEDKLYYLDKLDVSVWITLEDGNRVAYAGCRYGSKRIPLD